MEFQRYADSAMRDRLKPGAGLSRSGHCKVPDAGNRWHRRRGTSRHPVQTFRGAPTVSAGVTSMALRPQQETSQLATSRPDSALRIEPDVRGAAAGDADAFQRLYRRYMPRVYSLCVRMLGDQAESEEATQDVFVRLWDKLPLYRGDSAFSTWLHRLAVNVVLSRMKVRGTERNRFAGEETLEQVSLRSAPAGAAMDLEAAIAMLPAGARRVFVLHDVEGYTHEEIGDLLGISAGGSKAQLHRARVILRKALDR